MEKITAYENIKIVLCASINDKNYREECLKTWITKGKNLLKLTIDIQNYYIYYSSLYNYYNEETNDILKKLGNLPKYKEIYKANLSKKKDDNELLKQITADVKVKLDEFCKNNKMDKNEVLIHLKYIINKEYNYDNLESIIRYCPLKFFFVYFTKYNFRIIPIFPYMLNIIKAELTEDECNNYFQKEKYKFNTIENDSVKGDYFEGAAKFGLQKIIKNAEKFKVNEIVTMEKIIYEEDEIIGEEEYIEMHNNIKTLLKQNEEIIFTNDEIDTNNNISKKHENEKEEKNGNYIQKEEDEDEKNEVFEEIEELEEGIEEEVKENKKKFNEKKLQEKKFYNLNELLKKFNIKKNKIKIENKYLTKDSILLSKTIEVYRQEEIREQLKLNEIIKKSNFNGDELLLIDQISKRGQTLDYAYLYGENNKKIFIGFKMKCYFENSILNSQEIDKIIIKEKCKKILVNSMKLFNCKIIEWHYILIFYYNSANLKENINDENLKRCKENGICFIFYDPVSQIFYDSSRKYIIENIIPNNTSNLDCTKINAKNFSIDPKAILNKYGTINVGKNIIDMKECFVKDFKKICKEENPTIFDILKQLEKNIDSRHKLYFGFQFPIIKEYISTPDNNSVFLYKKKESNDFIALIKVENKLKFFDASKNKIELFHFYNIFDEEAKYYYYLGLIKRRQIEKSEDKESEPDLYKEKVMFNIINIK